MTVITTLTSIADAALDRMVGRRTARAGCIPERWFDDYCEPLQWSCGYWVRWEKRVNTACETVKIPHCCP